MTTNDQLTTPDCDLSDNPDIACGIFSFSKEGPVVQNAEYNDLDNHTCIEDVELLFYKSAINYSVIICNGGSYPQGVFELPVPNCSHYRVILIAFHMSNDGDIPSHRDYRMVALYVPTVILTLVPPIGPNESDIIASAVDILDKTSNISLIMSELISMLYNKILCP